MKIEDQIVAAAKGWLNVPYKHAGRSRFGVDCAGLIVKVAHDVGLSDYDSVNYPRRPVPEDFLREMRDHLVPVPVDQMGHGHVAVFREPKHPCHTGIIEVDEAGRRWVIHAYAPARKVIREPLSSAREHNVVFVFRYKTEELA
jgi:hypothetical protein